MFLLALILNCSFLLFWLLFSWRRVFSRLSSLFFCRWRRSLFFYLSGRIAPGHDIANQYEHFTLLEGFLHGLYSKLNIRDFCLVQVIDIDLALFNNLLTE